MNMNKENKKIAQERRAQEREKQQKKNRRKEILEKKEKTSSISRLKEPRYPDK